MRRSRITRAGCYRICLLASTYRWLRRRTHVVVGHGHSVVSRGVVGRKLTGMDLATRQRVHRLVRAAARECGRADEAGGEEGDRPRNHPKGLTLHRGAPFWLGV